MTLSIVIVNYNVRHYLEQCLTSILDAVRGIETEIFVVDNNSVDDSLMMLRRRFPQVRLIANANNPGFAKANNQALRLCTGEYILLLNPDTIVENDTLSHCINFIANTPRCGGVCVKMVNGEGEFLKESKRGFPSPATSFYKISGLIRLLPHHRKVSAYYMGHLSENETNVVDILPGAFIMMKKDVLNQVGLLDESYFMYGEDIDFSWRIHLAGYDNYYLPSARILHYKGESTKRGNMNYVYAFYNAMSIFVQRYFAGGNAQIYNLLIQLAIWLRALLAMLQRFARHALVPIADLLLSFAGFYLTKELWATYWAENVNYYPTIYTWGILPIYSLVMMFSMWLCGGYDKPVRLERIVRGVAIGAIILLAFYSLLDETQRYSRAILLIGALWTILSTLMVRMVLSFAGIDGYSLGGERKKKYLVVGHNEEQARIHKLFGQLGIIPKKIEILNPDSERPLSQQIKEKLKKNSTENIIFSSIDVSVHEMLTSMQALNSHGIQFFTAPAYGNILIGSNRIYCLEELYSSHDDIIATPRCRRNKRIFDIVCALFFLIMSPLTFWFQRHKRNYFAKCWNVVTGEKTWVSYSQGNLATGKDETPLPYLKPGILQTRHIMPRVQHPDLNRLDQDYAQHYKTSTDFVIVLRNWNRI
ncbi:MAG: glycosyltransferase [Bacteroidales bacterium]|nr:glycosyltransferase [Bacteroidales bacterium]